MARTCTSRRPTARAELVSLREDVHGGVTSVTLADGVHTLYTNGKFQGNTGWEMEAQRLFAHYPSMFVERFDRALVIGLGTGTTLGTLAAYPWKQLDVAEISPAIVDAASRYFGVPNRGVLDDPRVAAAHRRRAQLPAGAEREVRSDQHGAVEHLVCRSLELVQRTSSTSSCERV